MKFMNKIGAFTLAAMLAVGASPATALAADAMAPVEKKTIQWLSTEEQPQFAQTITVGGVEYTLQGEPVIKEVKTETATIPADHTESVECWPSNLNATMNSFPETYHAEKDDYEGDIPRTDVSYAPVNAQRSWEVNTTRVYSGLASNDTMDLTREISYSNPETGHTVTLALASVSWSVDATDANGMPTSYSANCIYRGVDSDIVLDHYVVTATWEGDIPSKTPVTTYEATLTYQGPVPEPAPAEENDFNLLPIIGGVVAAAAAASGVGVFYWRRRRNATLYKVSEDGSALQEKARLRAGSGKQTRELEIPVVHNIVEGRWVVGLVGAAASEPVIKITWGGKTVYEGPASERIEL